jgi:hypothetical protein
MPWLARGTGLCRKTVRESVRRLIARGVLHLMERNTRTGYLVRVRLPEELRAVRAAIAASRPAPPPRSPLSTEDTDFLQTRPLRSAIHQREGGHCFYCLRRLNDRRRCLDHVVPRARAGSNFYRNLVSCCLDCNSQKRERSAEEHLRGLFRERRLSDAELTARLRALDDLAAGKLIPPLPGQWVKGRESSQRCHPEPGRALARGKRA